MGDIGSSDDKQPKKKSFWETFPGFLTALAAIITALGTLLTALAATGVLKLSDSPVLPTLTATMQAATNIETATPGLTPESITITLENTDCYEVEFYVDSELIGTAPAESQVNFQTTPGSHSTVLCYTDGTCTDATSRSWMKSTTWTVYQNPSCQSATPSPTAVDLITITLVNNDCHMHDFYVDNQLATTVAAGSQIDFQTSPGQHSTYVCFAGTGNCGPESSQNWLSSATTRISRGDNCAAPTGELITVSLNNENCPLQDFYVDNRLLATVDEGQIVEFGVIPGSHTTKSCSSGTVECGEALSVEWNESLDWSITCN